MAMPTKSKINTEKPAIARRDRPRLYGDASHLRQVRRLVAGGDGRKLLDAMLVGTRPVAEHALASDDLPAMLAGTDPQASPALDRLFDMAVAWTVGGDSVCRDAAVGILAALPQVDRHLGRPIENRLCLARAMPVSIPGALDLLWHELPETQRRRLARWLARTVIKKTVAHVRPTYLLGAGGNISVRTMTMALMTLLCVWGDEAAGDLSAWRDELLTYYSASVCNVLGPDGYPDEDGGYGPVVTSWLVELAHALHHAGWMDAFERFPRLKRFPRAMLAIMQPWGLYLSNTGDHTDNFRHREFMLARLAVAANDPAAAWLATALTHDRPSMDWLPSLVNMGIIPEVPQAAGGQLPASGRSILALPHLKKAKPTSPAAAGVPLAFRDRSRGLVTFRDSWQPDATLLLVDGSQRRPGAQGHFHAACGHFSLTALGEYFAIDTGRYCIEQDQHNLMLHRGVSGRSTQGQWKQALHHGVLTGYHPHPLCDLASVDSSHQYGNVRWAWRSAGLVKQGPMPAYAWTIDFLNANDDWDHYAWTLNTSPENVIRLGRRSATITGCRHGHHLDVHWVLPASAPRPHRRNELTIRQDIQVAGSEKYISPDKVKGERGHDRPRDMVHGAVFRRPRLIADLHDYTGQLLSIMLPRRQGEPKAKVKSLPCLQGSLAVSVESQGVRDVLIWAFTHGQLQADGIQALGKAVLVRRRTDTGRLLDWWLHEGDELIVDGRRVALNGQG